MSDAFGASRVSSRSGHRSLQRPLEPARSSPLEHRGPPKPLANAAVGRAPPPAETRSEILRSRDAAGLYVSWPR